MNLVVISVAKPTSVTIPMTSKFTDEWMLESFEKFNILNIPQVASFGRFARFASSVKLYLIAGILAESRH